MKKLILLFLFIPTIGFSQLYLNNNQVKINTQLYGQVEYDAIMAGFDSPSTMNPDTLWFAKNKFGATMTVDSIRVESSTDDQDLIVVSRGWAGGSVSRIDSCGASTNGAGCFYGTQTSITDASIAVNETIGIKKPSITSTSVQLTIYFHYTKTSR